MESVYSIVPTMLYLTNFTNSVLYINLHVPTMYFIMAVLLEY